MPPVQYRSTGSGKSLLEIASYLICRVRFGEMPTSCKELGDHHVWMGVHETADNAVSTSWVSDKDDKLFHSINDILRQ